MATGGVENQPGTGGLGEINPAVEVQDLSRDPLVANAPFTSVNGKPAPILGGIPLLAKLGQGGMGAVYYGIHPRLECEVAVKVLPFHLAEQQPELIQRFFREAQIAATVRSPHLVLVTDVNQESGLCYLVMEFVNGKSAGAYLKAVKQAGEKGLEEEEALDICIAATTGLDAAHRCGIVHRDIKPDNIMIPKCKGADRLNLNAAKLADLGLARGEEIGQSLTDSASCLGTPGYMPPEQYANAKSVRKPGDVFSMGATLYALLSGRAPFVADALFKCYKLTAETPHQPIRELRPDVSESTAKLIDICLAKDATQRYPDANALLEALKLCRQTIGKAQDVEQLQALTRIPEVGDRVKTPTPVALPSRRPKHAGETPAVQGGTHVPPMAAGTPAVRTNRKPLLIAGGILAVALLAFATGQLESGKRAPDTQGDVNVTLPEAPAAPAGSSRNAANGTDRQPARGTDKADQPRVGEAIPVNTTTVFEFRDRNDVLSMFDMEGGWDVVSNELVLTGRPHSGAKTKAVFSYPIKIEYQMYLFPDRTYDIFPGFAGINLCYASYANTRTEVRVGTMWQRLAHRRAVPNHLYNIVFDVDVERALTITIDGVSVFRKRLDPDLALTGHVWIGRSLGHAACKKIIVQTYAQGAKKKEP